MTYREINADINIKSMEEDLLLDGELQVVEAKCYSKYTLDQINFFSHKHAFYTLPTVELIDWLSERIKGKRAIEICAGSGIIGKALGIPCSDNYMQKKFKEVVFHYNITKQPTVNYGSHVIEKDANMHVKEECPDVTIGSWVTQKFCPKKQCGNAYGPIEEDFFRYCKTYIHLGNKLTHDWKDIVDTRDHESLYFDWYKTRSMVPHENRIYIF